MDCCDVLCGIMTCCSLCTLCEPSACNCCSKKDHGLDDPTSPTPSLVQDQPHHTHPMMVRGMFAEDGQNTITYYQGAKPKLR